MQVQSLGGDPLEKEMTTHSSILACRIPWTEEPGRLQSKGLHRVRHNWSNLACMHTEGHRMMQDSPLRIYNRVREWGHPDMKMNAISIQSLEQIIDTSEVILGAFMAGVSLKLVLKGPRENVKRWGVNVSGVWEGPKGLGKASIKSRWVRQGSRVRGEEACTWEEEEIRHTQPVSLEWSVSFFRKWQCCWRLLIKTIVFKYDSSDHYTWKEMEVIENQLKAS